MERSQRRCWLCAEHLQRGLRSYFCSRAPKIPLMIDAFPTLMTPKTPLRETTSP